MRRAAGRQAVGYSFDLIPTGLQREEPSIGAANRHQGRVITLLTHDAIADDDDMVGVADSVQAV
jgi:hypothetical protein